MSTPRHRRGRPLAPNTVVRAYSQLASEGWVVTLPRRGVVVAGRAPAVSAEDRPRELTGAVSELLVVAHQLGVRSTELLAEVHRQLRAREEGT